MSREDFDDEPLSVPGKPEQFVTDTTPPVTPETFDLVAFLEGARPTRRTVPLYLRADLIATMDELAQRIDSTPDGVDVDQLVAAFEQAREAFRANVLYWTVEKRSSEWITDRWAAYAKQAGIVLTDGDTKNMKDRLRLLIDQLCGQVVEVKTQAGDAVPLERVATHEALRRLFDTNEGEFNKLLYAMRDANESMAHTAKVLTRDFSRTSSTSRSGSGS